MIKSKVCDILNIKYPIFQGGMAWIADAELAAAVSNAGGLGIIAAMNSNKEQVREEIKKAKALTDKPFAVNIMLMSRYAPEVAEVVIEENVKVVTTGAGNPSKYMAKWIEAGIKVIPVVPSVSIAKLVQRSGATAVIAEGCEAGGHIGELTTMTLIPQIVDAVDIPVIAAGGIGDGRSFAAALMLGASGVQMGTKFLVAHECSVHPNYKQKVIESKDMSSITTGKRLGHPVRSIKNPFSRSLAKMEYDMTIDNEYLEKLGVGALRKAAKEGDVVDGCVMAGQVSALVKKEQSCSEIIEDILKHTEDVLRGISKCLI